MKKQDITFQDKLNELRLDVKHPNNAGQTFVLVEGDSDIRLFRKFFNLENAKVECVPGGNPKVEDCVEELVKIYPLVIGIRDSDFIHLTTDPYIKLNMFLTDYHDMEMSLISEDEVFSALVFEYTSVPKEKHPFTRNAVIQTIEQISYLKWLNQIENLEIKFKETGFQDLILFANLEINFLEYFKRLLSKSPEAKITDVSIILTKINELKKRNPNQLHLCNGHDFMKAFSQYIKEQGKTKSINDDIISSAFRISFTNEFLTKTSLYHNIKAWADSKNCVLFL